MCNHILRFLLYLTPRCVPVMLLLIIATAQAEFAPAQGYPTFSRIDQTQFIPHNTWIRTGFFAEVSQDTFTEVTIHSPSLMTFEWGTTIQNADQGFWRLLRQDPVRQDAEPTYTQLATGVATPAPGGLFYMDLSLYLPPNPPSVPEIYHVQVIARKQATTDHTSNTSPGQSGAKIPAQTLGLWSAPVVITYSVNTDPGTRFEFPEVYRKATLVLDKITLVEDQSGSGQEEYFIAGFIQELFQHCDDVSGENCRFSIPGRQASFAPDLNNIDLSETCDTITVRPYFRCLNPPAESNFGLNNYYDEPNRWTFRLNNAPWPRTFSTTISLMEQDDGGLMEDWIDGIDFVKDETATGNLFDLHGLDENAILDYIKNSGIGEEDIVGIVVDILQVINTVANVSSAAIVGGAVAVVAVPVISAILADMEDDYYGTAIVSLVLPSNRVEDIHSLPGHVTGEGENQKYMLDSKTLRFYGPPLENIAGAFDGIIDITLHWEFSKIEVQ